MMYDGMKLTALLGALFLFGASMASAATIEVWSRGTGQHRANAEVKRVNQMKITLDTEKLTRDRVFDFQYNKEVELEGLTLTTIVRKFKPQAHDDAIILHFANGMAVPLPSPFETSLKRTHLFVAHRIKQGKKWTTKFPEVAKASEKWNDPRPITFDGARISSPTGWHFDTKVAFPMGKAVPPPKDPDVPPPFSPWRSVSSLVGIEFVNEAAYYDQFTATRKGQNGPGYKVWRQRCQFCHGTDRVGAGYGWDFLHPIALHKMKKAEHLYNKVKYTYHDALERGLMMPQQPDVKSVEMKHLVKWIANLDKKGPRPYRP